MCGSFSLLNSTKCLAKLVCFHTCVVLVFTYLFYSQLCFCSFLLDLKKHTFSISLLIGPVGSYIHTPFLLNLGVLVMSQVFFFCLHSWVLMGLGWKRLCAPISSVVLRHHTKGCFLSCIYKLYVTTVAHALIALISVDIYLRYIFTFRP